MPNVNDYDENDEDDGGVDAGFSPAQSAAVGSATGGAKEASRERTEPQSSYVPWSSFENANRGVSEREAKELEGRVQSDVDKAKGGLADAQKTFDEGLAGNYGKAPTPEVESRELASEAPRAAGGNLGRSSAAEAMGAEQPASQAGNPWASFLPGAADQSLMGADSGAEAMSSQAMTAAPPAAMQDKFAPEMRGGAGTLLANELRPIGLTEAAAAGGPTGAKSLEAAAGTKWQQLLGDTLKASQEAKALGSEAGVQGLLEQQQTSPIANSAFDATLISGAGRPAFDALSKQYGGKQLEKGVLDAQKSSQDRWAQLQGDVDKRQGWRQKPGSEAIGGERGDGQAVDISSGDPQADADLNQLLFGDGGADANFWSTLHQAGLTLSPADWAAFAAGEAGEDTPMPTEEFSKNFDPTGGRIQQSWPQGKFQMAWGVVGKQYPPEAMRAFLNFLGKNPDVLKQYLSMKNPGFMARNMRQWMESSGYRAGSNMLGTSNSEGQQAGAFGGGAAAVAKEQGTSEEDEIHRNEIAAGRPYTDENGRVWRSVSEWDEAHRKTGS